MAPVIVSFSEKFMNIWEIPFAAVTICPISGLMPLNDNFKETNDTNVTRVPPLNKFSGSISTRITNVTWMNNPVNSEDIFTEIATEEGFCWTFNMMNFDNLFKDTV